MNSNQKNKAIALRKQGLSYSEVLKKVPVAKSTLSLWLREVGLSKVQKQRLTQKKLEAAYRGAMSRKNDRIFRQKQIMQTAYSEVGVLSSRERWLIGVALYWAEGSKEKEYRHGSSVQFSNSDPHMVRFFFKWLIEICRISRVSVSFDIYIHESSAERLVEVKKYWSKVTSFPADLFSRIYFKRHNIKTNRRKVDDLYYGQLRIKVNASSVLLRRIEGWISGIK